MVVHARVSRRAPKRSVVTNSLPIAFLIKLPGEPKVNRVNDVALATDAQEKIVRLDVAVEIALVVDILDSIDTLIGDQQHRLERELSATVVEDVFEGWTQEFLHKDMVVALPTEPYDTGNTDTACECLVGVCLVLERLEAVVAYVGELDGHFFLCLEVGA